jgi:hypothetical protein
MSKVHGSIRSRSITQVLSIPTPTREYRGYEVPEVLLNGHHEDIEKWRAEQSRIRTEEMGEVEFRAPAVGRLVRSWSTAEARYACGLHGALALACGHGLNEDGVMLAR